MIENDFGLVAFLGIETEAMGDGVCRMAIDVNEARHFNPHGVAHGGVAYALADHTMGGAVMTLLDGKHWCATIEIKMNYHVGVTTGRLVCEATVLHKGKRIANIDAKLHQNGRLVASANGNFAIFPAPH